MKNIIFKILILPFVLLSIANLQSAVINVYEYANPMSGLSIQPTDAVGDDLTQTEGTTNFLIKGSIISGQFDDWFDSTGTGDLGPGGAAIFQDGDSPGSNTIIQIDFDEPKAIQEVHIFTSWGDARVFSWIVVQASTGGTNDDDYTEVGIATFGAAGDPASNYPQPGVCVARLYDDATGVLKGHVRSLRLIQKTIGWTGGSPQQNYSAPGPVLAGCASYEIDVIGEADPSIATPSESFALTNHIISTSFFHWFTSTGGQLSGPWLPRDGRASWTGESAWWKSQIKQVMLAGIDVLYVHLIPTMEQQRINLFRALFEMRLDGYEVPKVAPFLDPVITWDGQPKYSLSIATNREKIVNQYIRFFNQYYSVNTDQYADDYIDVIDNRVVLDTWHLGENFTDISSFSRSDMEAPLAAEFGTEHPVFSNGIYQITTETSATFTFADEKVSQFQNQDYSHITDYNGIKSDQLKAGYWDQNIRDPGTCLKRDGGSHYSNSWVTYPDALTVKRVYIESWNEYDEGSGIYAANPTQIYRVAGNTSTDVWSSTEDSFEYIKTTYNGARTFKRFEIGSKGSKILYRNFPDSMFINRTNYCEVYVRNAGFDLWSSNNAYCFGQKIHLTNETAFGSGRYYFNDSENEVALYGGIFKGRPVKFDVEIIAPSVPSNYVTHWGMLQEGVEWFGEEITNNIDVIPEPTMFLIFCLIFFRRALKTI